MQVPLAVVGWVGELKSSQPSFSILRMVVVPRPVQETMSVLASAIKRSERSYRGCNCLKNSVSSYAPRRGPGVGGISPVINVNERLGDLKEVATASMYPVNTEWVRPVSSADGSLPTQMPPAACLSSGDVGEVMAFLKEIRLNCRGIGGHADEDFVSARAMMSVWSSRVVS